MAAVDYVDFCDTRRDYCGGSNWIDDSDSISIGWVHIERDTPKALLVSGHPTQFVKSKESLLFHFEYGMPETVSHWVAKSCVNTREGHSYDTKEALAIKGWLFKKLDSETWKKCHAFDKRGHQ